MGLSLQAHRCLSCRQAWGGLEQSCAGAISHHGRRRLSPEGGGGEGGEEEIMASFYGWTK